MDTDLAILDLGAVAALPPAPERHLATPEEWVVYGADVVTCAPSVMATAMAVYAGWLVLWRDVTPVAVFRPGHWTGAAVRYRHGY